MSNQTPHDYNSANQWAQNQNNNSTNPDSNNEITWFWIMTIVLLCLLVAWWWWCNYRPKDTSNNVISTSPLNDLKNGANNSNTKLQMTSDGNVV